jgi:dsDNA-specific endonuclease/ATPase MutS2
VTEDRDDDEVREEIVLPLEDAIDLHAFSPRDVKSVTEAYLEQALEAGLREIRLIHGRGIGAQRETVRAVLSRHPGVVSFADAPGERGGWGATVAHLAPTSNGEFDAARGVTDNADEDRNDG